MAYVIVAHWRARAGEESKVEGVLRDLAAAVRTEPGNLQFIVNRSHDDPREFLLYEQYKDEQAFRDHQETAHFKTLVLERGVPLLDRRERRVFSVVG